MWPCMVQLNSSNNFWRNGMLAKYIYVTYTEEQKQQVIRVPNSLAIGFDLNSICGYLVFSCRIKISVKVANLISFSGETNRKKFVKRRQWRMARSRSKRLIGKSVCCCWHFCCHYTTPYPMTRARRRCTVYCYSIICVIGIAIFDW